MEKPWLKLETMKCDCPEHALCSSLFVTKFICSEGIFFGSQVWLMKLDQMTIATCNGSQESSTEVGNC